MKKISLIIAALIFFNCQNMTKETVYFIETKTSFFEIKNSPLLSNKWLRKSENIEMIHETFKKYGYADLFSEIYHDEQSFTLKDINIKKNIFGWIDSLILTYQNPNIKSKYYRDFWDRRKNEKNNLIVFKVLKDIQDYQMSKVEPRYSESLVNDTLFDLLQIEFRHEILTSDIAIENFDKLIKYRLHHSAYNILNERSEYYDIEWDKEQLMKDLIKADKYQPAWMIDNTK